jgi:hypothetical protein
MNQEIAKNLMCITMMNGLEIWKEEDRMLSLIEQLKSGKTGFVGIDNILLNTSSILSITPAGEMQDQTRRKNGQWKCKHGTWHERGEQCACSGLEMYPKWNGQNDQ